MTQTRYRLARHVFDGSFAGAAICGAPRARSDSYRDLCPDCERATAPGTVVLAVFDKAQVGPYVKDYRLASARQQDDLRDLLWYAERNGHPIALRFES